MQPAQLSLLPDQIPPPAPTLLANMPEDSVGEAVSLLAALIAKASPIRGRGTEKEAVADE